MAFLQTTQQNQLLFIFFNSVYETLQNKQVGIRIFLDFNKEFDYIERSILLAKLENYGVKVN